MNTNVKDMTGQQIGRWTFLERAGSQKGTTGTMAMWKVRCSCGTEAIRSGSAIRSGILKSCGCINRQRAATMSREHSGPKHANWGGGRSVSKTGYVTLAISEVRKLYPNASIRSDLKKKQSMMEHHAAMSHHLNRPLRKGETVHHINGDRSDNRIENLELKAKAHGPGQSIEDQIAWAKEILRRYT